jgi:hypothetical protein
MGVVLLPRTPTLPIFDSSNLTLPKEAGHSAYIQASLHDSASRIPSLYLLPYTPRQKVTPFLVSSLIRSSHHFRCHNCFPERFAAWGLYTSQENNTYHLFGLAKRSSVRTNNVLFAANSLNSLSSLRRSKSEVTVATSLQPSAIYSLHTDLSLFVCLFVLLLTSTK